MPVKNPDDPASWRFTSQNHSYAVGTRPPWREPGLEATHINLLDNTVEGLPQPDGPGLFSVQYHPEERARPPGQRVPVLTSLSL